MNSDPILISIPFDKGEIRLPCQPLAVLKLFTEQFCADRPVDSKKQFDFLIANPALLVFAMVSLRKSDQIKLGDVKRWFMQFDGWTDLQLIESGNSLKGERKLQKQLSIVRTSRCFWKAVQRFVVRQRGSQHGGKLKTKRFPNLSKGTLKAVRKSAERQLRSGNMASSGIDIRRLLARLRESQKIQRDFDRELLRQKLDAMRLLAYGASHEINNPLANVATRAQSLLQDEADPARRHRLAVIYEQAMRAHEMISDMMLFAHPPQVDPKSMDLTECVRGVVEELASDWNRTGIRCEVTGPAALIVGDEAKLASAAKSLIVNAIEAIGSDGLIRVEISSGEEVCLAISDSGPGIDPEIDANIFDPFFSGREAGRGLGFGLSKAWRIAQMHGATIERGASELGGARFVIRFSKRVDPQSITTQQELAAA